MIKFLKNHPNKFFQLYFFFSIFNKMTLSNISILFSLLKNSFFFTSANPFQKTLRISINTFDCTRETKTGTFNRNEKFFKYIFKETSKFLESKPVKIFQIWQIIKKNNKKHSKSYLHFKSTKLNFTKKIAFKY